MASQHYQSANGFNVKQEPQRPSNFAPTQLGRLAAPLNIVFEPKNFITDKDGAPMTMRVDVRDKPTMTSIIQLDTQAVRWSNATQARACSLIKRFEGKQQLNIKVSDSTKISLIDPATPAMPLSPQDLVSGTEIVAMVRPHMYEFDSENGRVCGITLYADYIGVVSFGNVRSAPVWE